MINARTAARYRSLTHLLRDKDFAFESVGVTKEETTHGAELLTLPSLAGNATSQRPMKRNDDHYRTAEFFRRRSPSAIDCYSSCHAAHARRSAKPST